MSCFWLLTTQCCISSYRCDCEPGWVGKNCDLDRNDCLPSPCQNAGTCIDQLNGFTCKCRQGFRGRRVAHNTVTPDYSFWITIVYHPLVVTFNVWIYWAVQTISTFYVLWWKSPTPSLTGNLCQLNINECASSPCLNKGTCVDGVASFTCRCELPYSGPTCAEVLTPCSPNPCANNAVCTHTPDYLGYQCNCQSGWQG